MALALGLRPGSKFYLNDIEVLALDFDEYSSATVEVKGKKFRITDQESVEIMPQVRVSCGLPSAGRLDKYRRIMGLLKEEEAGRKRALDDGKLTQEEFKSLPPLVVPYEYLPRLIIEAPRTITILRQELYERQKRRS